jgi:23S rRNA (guanosine2251-2'-O)-methyltransferase
MDILRAAERAGVSIRDADDRTLRLLTRSEAHQGVAARTGPFRYREFPPDGIERPSAFLVLDRIQDPHNLGALVRTAAAVGMGAVVIPKHGAVGLTASAEKVAAGAANDIPICRVTNIRRTLDELRNRGYWAVALLPREGQNLFEMDIPERPVLVLGGETGMRPLVRGSCDLIASIPQSAVVESLNVSVAGAVAMYDLLRRGLLDRSEGGW